MSEDAEKRREAGEKAISRAIASCATWFISGGQPLSSVPQIMMNTKFSTHMQGAFASASQRGSSAGIMFMGQHVVNQAIGEPTRFVAVNAGLAGLIGGGASAFIHSVFEPLKIRAGEGFRFNTYIKALPPMLWRHGLFDAGFFFTTSLTKDQPYSIQFATSALAASVLNLTHDVWKTKLIAGLPRRVRYMEVIRMYGAKQWFKHFIVKSLDLGANWFVTGAVYQYLFSK